MSHDVTIRRKSKASRYPKEFICPTCQRPFSTKGNLDFHYNSIHLRATSFPCDLCPKVFAQAGNLKTHKLNVHRPDKFFSCSFCPQTFKHKGDYTKHAQMQHPQANPQINALQQPQQTQSFHPPAQIEIVQNPLLLGSSGSLQHIVTTTAGTAGGHAQHTLVHGKPKRKNFIPLQTISETDLIRQGVQVIHPTQVTVTALDGTPGGTPLDLGLYSTPHKIPQPIAIVGNYKKKKHACNLCDKAFAQIINLRTHVATVHEGKKNYPCPECDKNFTQKGNLKAHITTIHQKLKNFQCVYCHKLFSQKGNMKTHIKNTHS
ncbi:Uncharacterized protein FKW44_001809 [Caligus rogercresseyi]|uniref:C2H2-type domain-containing protein n=1 Tax=Caligus rogercresseyi TaxID=217165 RepID=A0A7T8KJA0_CALRO|nr:Uncharacterized protein FKW44_001809 [Caligus rogercresseyi]|eukprot:TRINITY_DN1236_c0_g1_i1.p1 TRINITY_DN1236_c0_g1~~TRINITY_DN1236_c0_g1_i1.p1  ORF type:complete len:317 (-),score=106.36 TRINITY_DN1236_c0_g1_i1:311-1261(-)